MGGYENLSTNLSYAEAVRSEQAKRLGIDNTPSKRQLDVMRHLAVNLFQPVRDYFGEQIFVSSFFRCQELNKAIGGAIYSDHMVSADVAAIDLDNDGIEAKTGVSNADIFYYIFDHMPYFKLIWEFGDRKKPAWVHISFSINESKNEQRNTYIAVRNPDRTVNYKQFKDMR